MTTDTRFGDLLARDIQIKTIHDQGLEIERLRAENENLRRWKALDKPLTAAMEIANSHLARKSAEIKRGWEEATIAWSVCASIHREYAKGKDPFFKTRQADFVRHENDARATLTAGERTT